METIAQDDAEEKAVLRQVKDEGSQYEDIQSFLPEFLQHLQGLKMLHCLC